MTDNIQKSEHKSDTFSKEHFLCDMSVGCNALVLHLISFTEKAEPHVPARLCCASSSGLMLQKMWTMYVIIQMLWLNKWVQIILAQSVLATHNYIWWKKNFVSGNVIKISLMTTSNCLLFKVFFLYKDIF